MKTMMKRIFIITMCIFCAIPLMKNEYKVSASTSGKIGENVKYDYNTSSKTLTIEGSGPIDQSAVFDAPWEAYQEDIEYVIVEEGVTTLPDYTFMNLVNMRKIKLASTITSLGWYTFCDCESLKEIFLPKDLKSIKRGAFNGCTSLESFTVSKYNEHYVAKDGVLFTKDMKQLVLYPAAKENKTYTIPNGVKEVFDYAFCDNQNIETLKMSNSVTTFLGSACHSMDALKRVVFSDSIQYLYSNAFAYCFELQNVEIPASMVSIGDHCFYANRNLNMLSVYGKDTNIGYFKDSYPSNTLIVAYSGSKAQAYAKRTGKRFQNLTSGKVTNYLKDNQTLMDELPTSGLAAGEPTYHNVHMSSYPGVFSGYQTFILHESDTSNQYYQEIKTKVNELCKGLKSDKAKAKAISSFVHGYLDYGMGYLGNSIGAVYKAWVNKKGSCEIYTILTNYMLYLADIPTATITSSAHEWSAALIDGEWITIDATNNEFDIDPNDQPAINGISFSHKKGVYLMDGYDGITLAGIGYGYNSDCRTCFKSYSVPSFVTNIHSAATELTNNQFYLKGKKKTSMMQSLKNEGFCVTSDDDYYYARNQHGATTMKVYKATSSKDGHKDTVCQKCGGVIKSVVIPKVSNISLSHTTYTYYGNSRKPSVIVKDRLGNIIPSSCYSVSYDKGRVNVGKYDVKITFKGENYQGSVVKTFQIRPKTTSIKSLVATKHSIKVNYHRKATQTSGYQIQYATNSKFENAKTKLVKDSYQLSTTLSSLKRNTKYYIRIRTYKNVTYHGKSIKVYSPYSPLKTIKTK